jgi:hypothetical protein
MGGDPGVTTVHDALATAHTLKVPTEIQVREEGKFWRILRHRFGDDDLPTVEIDEDDVAEEEYEPMEEMEAPF